MLPLSHSTDDDQNDAHTPRYRDAEDEVPRPGRPHRERPIGTRPNRQTYEQPPQSTQEPPESDHDQGYRKAEAGAAWPA